jgi:hypothetical protein
MAQEPAIASFEFPSGPLRGTQLSLSASRLLHLGVGHMESVALSAIASVSVGYQRDTQGIGRGATLIVVALILFALFQPLGALAARVGAEVADGQAVGQLLRAVMRSLEIFASLMPVIAAALLAWGGAMVWFGWKGATTLVLSLPATERVYQVRGMNHLLRDFSELLAERVSQHNR